MASALTAMVVQACSHNWDAYDPRLGSPSSGGRGTGDASAGSGGQPSGGSGGAAASGGGGATDDSGAAGGMGGAAGGAGGVAGSAGSGGGTCTFYAKIATCLDPNRPDAGVCDGSTGPHEISVDGSNSMFGNDPTVAFLRFDIGSCLSGKTVQSAKLYLTVGNSPQAHGYSSGSVWTVTAFSSVSLPSAPSQVKQVAPNANGTNGPFADGTQVEWTLSLTNVSPANPVCLGIYPANVDGIDYEDANGANPPKLVVQYK